MHKQYIREGRFGLFWYDGSPQGKAKPLAACIRFLSQYLTYEYQQGMKAISELNAHLQLRPALTGVHIAFTFSTQNAYFAGDMAPGYADEKLLFQPLSATASSVYIFWSNTSAHTDTPQGLVGKGKQTTVASSGPVMYVMCSADTSVQLRTAAFSANFQASKLTISGIHGAVTTDSTWLNITLLSGETVSLTSQ